jgi:hypothetical protein
MEYKTVAEAKDLPGLRLLSLRPCAGVRPPKAFPGQKHSLFRWLSMAGKPTRSLPPDRPSECAGSDV